jgi:hypothetical protein
VEGRQRITVVESAARSMLRPHCMRCRIQLK